MLLALMSVSVCIQREEKQNSIIWDEMIQDGYPGYLFYHNIVTHKQTIPFQKAFYDKNGCRKHIAPIYQIYCFFSM